MPESNSVSSLHRAYDTLLASGDLKPDPAQAALVDILQKFADAFDERERQPSGGFSAAIKRFLSHGLLTKRAAQETGKSGLYIHGHVGRGKSTLMGLFYDQVKTEKKRRVHFHQFMLEIHERLNRLRQSNSVSDIMERLARDIAEETALLCFDEFHVGNIADAMILGRLFSGLFDAGVTIVSTSNWAPDELYKNGLQRDRFLPFIALIQRKMRAVEIDGLTDYRYEQLRFLDNYIHPLGPEATRALQGIFQALTHGAQPKSVELPVEGRTLTLPHAACGIGLFDFDRLCGEALGPADYLAIAECLHTVVLNDVPLLGTNQRNETVRFMTLIDALYEARVKLFMASAVPVRQLAAAPDLSATFQRTVSRLMEMQGEAYRLKPHMG